MFFRNISGLEMFFLRFIEIPLIDMRPASSGSKGRAHRFLVQKDHKVKSICENFVELYHIFDVNFHHQM